VRRLLPTPLDPVDPRAVYADLPRAPGRPGVRLNMVASVDGATALEGVSGGLGGAADRLLFALLRSLADVVLVGAGTVRAEGYGPSDRPRLAIVTRSCHLDWDARVFAEARVRPIVVTAAAALAERRARAAEVADVIVAGRETVDLRAALAAIGRTGAGAVLAEGGPTLNGALAAAGLVDELCLTISPRLVGGDARRVLAGPALSPAPAMRLASACEEDGFLFLRYRADRSMDPAGAVVVA
jgi:riboflavin biosynthesis pyrimidine reductase